MWIFESGTGKFRDPSGDVKGFGYSGGDQGRRPEGKNNPAMEAIVDVGPIVCGNYTALFMEPHHPTLGNFAIRLQPDAITRAKILSYGRNPDTFYMHGDNPAHIGESSDGCIVMSLDVRQAFWNSSNRDLQVVSGPIAVPDLDGEISV